MSGVYAGVCREDAHGWEVHEELAGERAFECRERSGQPREQIFLLFANDAAQVSFQDMGLCV